MMIVGRSEIQHLIRRDFLVKLEKDKRDCIDCTKQSREVLPDIHALTFRPTSRNIEWRHIAGLAIYR